MLMPKSGLTYTQGKPKQFSREDLDTPVTRDFCADCGTHLITRPPGLEQVVLKIGTLDNPAAFEAPQIAIYTIDVQDFHQIPEDMPKFEKLPEQ